jgi:GMP synthase (glutamine-hydrolysing)
MQSSATPLRASARILFVISEHAEGLTPAEREWHEVARARIASLTDADVDSVPYWAVDALSADVLVLSGSSDPWARHRQDELERFYEQLRRYPGPVLGICAGMQMLVRAGGGTVGAAVRATGGFAPVELDESAPLFAGGPRSIDVLKRHEDEVKELPSAFRVIATSPTCEVEAVQAVDRPWWGVQFHPEAWDDEHPDGRAILERFLHLALEPA